MLEGVTSAITTVLLQPSPAIGVSNGGAPAEGATSRLNAASAAATSAAATSAASVATAVAATTAAAASWSSDQPSGSTAHHCVIHRNQDSSRRVDHRWEIDACEERSSAVAAVGVTSTPACQRLLPPQSSTLAPAAATRPSLTGARGTTERRLRRREIPGGTFSAGAAALASEAAAAALGGFSGSHGRGSCSTDAATAI